MQLLLLMLTFLLSPMAKAGKIIGGHEAKPHSHPYMAYLQTYNDEGSSVVCGGFLIQEKFVLTAAHCKGSTITVTLGAHNIKEPEKTQQVITVRKAIQHPEYNSRIFSNDIMLLQLEKKAKLNRDVQLLRLPKANSRVKPGDLCQVAGWGQLAQEGEYPSTLQEVEVMVQKDEECETRYKAHYSSAIQMCVGKPKMKNAAFMGDSGGPLVCNNVVQGIVSHGECDGKPPSIYTKVSHFLHWIEKTMQHHLLQGAK
ncbi:granzyme-like protein 1 [Fukomys damarensis]|uniref:Granzyme-like protein 1 n=1 Tax=Fukomys damarensis TaxID=885580 RepID=A0A091DP92_FUKDA|nr:granzyme-like protein 1 [Fukomys damarensis]KFO32105.1 Granzyme-like protein 1 [Fukomys damarensis]